jgi:hypothetical protein
MTGTLLRCRHAFDSQFARSKYLNGVLQGSNACDHGCPTQTGLTNEEGQSLLVRGRAAFVRQEDGGHDHTRAPRPVRGQTTQEHWSQRVCGSTSSCAAWHQGIGCQLVVHANSMMYSLYKDLGTLQAWTPREARGVGLVAAPRTAIQSPADSSLRSPSDHGCSHSPSHSLAK